MSVKNVIFDIGNVIIDWQPYRALNGLFDSKQQMEKTLNEIGFFAWNFEQDKGRSWDDGIKVAEDTMPEYAEIFRSYRRGLAAAHSDLIPGTSELITELHQNGTNLYGITNAARESFEAAKSVAPAINLFSDVVVSADHFMTKPGTDIYELCLQRNNLTARESLFVDDVEANCDAAKSVDMLAHQFFDANSLRSELITLGVL